MNMIRLRASRAVFAVLATLAPVLPVLMRDGLGLAGAALVAYGAWLVYPAAGFIVGGGLLMAGAYLNAKAAA